jgi:signal transduction histidine kinase
MMTEKSYSPEATTSIDELQREVAGLQLLRRISLLTATTRARNRLLNDALSELQQFFAISGGGIYQMPNADAPLHLVAQRGIAADLTCELQKVPAGQGLIGRVVRTGIPHHWVDLHSEPQLYCKATLAAGWCSLLGHPLRAHDRSLGVLFLYHQQARQFSQAEIELLGQCCQLLAAAIDSSELVEKLEWQHRLTHAGQRELDRSRQQLREHVGRLEESNRSLEQANQMKDRFLALASHELRTPLTWIMTAIQMLENQREELPEESQALLMTIHQGGQRLNSLVEDLLEMARIEARDIYLARENIDLSLLLSELALQYGEEALCRQLNLEVGRIPNHICPLGDHHHLRRALERILKNALKFTPPGGFVKLEASHLTAEELRQRKQEMAPFCPGFFKNPLLHDHIDLCIVDSGVGIAEKDRLQIFDKFQVAGDLSLHGKQSHSVHGPSAGLGLPLARGMIEAHGGMVWVENSAHSETGSCFHILLPLQHASRLKHD